MGWDAQGSSLVGDRSRCHTELLCQIAVAHLAELIDQSVFAGP